MDDAIKALISLNRQNEERYMPVKSPKLRSMVMGRQVVVDVEQVCRRERQT